MSVIVPAGKNRREWVPQDPMVKTASTDGDEPKDELLLAAQGVLERQAEEEEIVIEAASKCGDCGKDKCKCEEDCECEDPCKCAAKEDEEVKEASTEEEVKDATPETEVKEACMDGTEVAPEIEAEAACGACGAVLEEAPKVVEEPAAVLEEVSDDGVITDTEEETVEESVEETVKGAVEEIEVALEEVKEAIGVQEDTHEEQAELGEGDSTDFTTEIVEDSVEEEEPVIASSEEEFCRFAKISPKNRTKLADYWKNSLGYPADYVDLLTKDYEK